MSRKTYADEDIKHEDQKILEESKAYHMKMNGEKRRPESTQDSCVKWEDTLAAEEVSKKAIQLEGCRISEEPTMMRSDPRQLH